MYRTAIVLSLMLAAACGLSLMAQAPSTNTEPQIHANMNQLMRGVLYPAANVVFSAQADDPAQAKVPPLHDPNMSTDPLISSFGGWQAVENAALGLAESANLLSIPGRRCVNGELAPVKDPSWTMFVQQMRDASMKAFKAAQTKVQDKMFEAAEVLSNSCDACHRRWRSRRPENHCK